MSVPIFVGNVALTVASFIVRGWALATVWAWFIVRWFGLPPLSYPEALGVSLLVTMLVVNVNAKVEKRDYWQSILLAMIMNLLCVGAGWCVRLFL